MGDGGEYECAGSTLGDEMNISLPKSIVGSDEFALLNEKQKASFIARLSFIREVLRESASWFVKKEGDFSDFTDNLELDLSSVALANLGDTENQVSTYFVHSVWNFDMKGSFRNCLRGDVRERLDENIFIFNSDVECVSKWFFHEVTMASSLFDDIIDAESFDKALACLIAIDAFVNRLLAALVKFRLF